MIRFLRSLFSWRHVGDRGAYAYYENAVTGARKAARIAGIAGPRHGAWLRREVQRLDDSGPRPPPPAPLHRAA